MAGESVTSIGRLPPAAARVAARVAAAASASRARASLAAVSVATAASRAALAIRTAGASWAPSTFAEGLRARIHLHSLLLRQEFCLRRLDLGDRGLHIRGVLLPQQNIFLPLPHSLGLLLEFLIHVSPQNFVDPVFFSLPSGS